MQPFSVGKYSTLGNSLFVAVKLTKNADPDKYKYSGYGIGFDANESFLLPDSSGFFKQVFIALLSFSGSVSIKCMSLNNESCVIRPALINLISFELNHYLFMISLGKYNGNCNTVE